jgi:hypothetical protein
MSCPFADDFNWLPDNLMISIMRREDEESESMIKEGQHNRPLVYNDSLSSKAISLTFIIVILIVLILSYHKHVLNIALQAIAS